MPDSDGNGKKYDLAVKGASTNTPTETLSPIHCVYYLKREVVPRKRPEFYTLLVIPDGERHFFSLWMNSILLSKTNIRSAPSLAIVAATADAEY